eukprot:TRINITY_DN23974_c0_g1_i1.p1 TRINITY_DN23974_c0_g1~~TRINITY_DN23974_c0_g1_i1.p1  ORF type:complete len:457 (-),score=43.10 TRINITY_DN23974_c0_g1_i1:152-1324(-)
MIPDRYPSIEDDEADIDLEAWAEAQATILERLNEVKNGSVENFCWVSHEEILDEEGHIVEGGLVAVVQKKATFRINFYRMQDFRTWVNVKPLDIGSNQRFADENDVWVVRLTDASETSRVPLPSLDSESSDSSRDGTTSEDSAEVNARAERLEVLQSEDFTSRLPIPQPMLGQLIPGLVPQRDEIFSFGLTRSSSIFKKAWQWHLFEAYLGAFPVTFEQGGPAGRTVLKAYGNRWLRNPIWTVTDASDNALFTYQVVRESQTLKVYKLSALLTSETLFTIHVQSEQDENATNLSRSLLPEGANRASLHVSISKGDSDTILYSGQTTASINEGGLANFVAFFRGNGTTINDLIAGVPDEDEGRGNLSEKVLHVDAFGDSALFLVASTLVLA